MLTSGEVDELCAAVELRFEEITKAEDRETDQPPSALYHYTSTDGLLGIMRGGEFWATNVTYLNDASELNDAVEIFRDELKSAGLKLGTWAQSSLDTAHLIISSIDHFVVSFCDDGDLLSQWRGYGSQDDGYSIGFIASTILAIAARPENQPRGSCKVRKILSDKTQKRAVMRKRIEVLRELLEPLAIDLEARNAEEVELLNKLWANVAACLHPTVALMKHSAFAAEREWRLVRTLYRRPVPGAEWPVEFRKLGGRLTPYLPIRWIQTSDRFPDEMRGVSAVCCGPSTESELKEDAVRDLLRSLASKSQVWSSRVPLKW